MEADTNSGKGSEGKGGVSTGRASIWGRLGSTPVSVQLAPLL